MPYNLVLPKPQPKQELFLKDEHFHVAFGGSRGGGKSWALRFKAIVLCAKHPGIIVMICRKTYPELKANHIEPMKKTLKIGTKDSPAKYNSSDKEMKFINGSLIRFRYNNHESDSDGFQGTECDVLMLDEATLFTKSQIDAMRACVRGVNTYPHRIYYTCNPNGVSMGYIKRLFIDRRFEEDEDPDKYSFIQSLLTDNQVLMDSNPEYMAYLKSLPNKLRMAWLEGRWDVFEGSFFENFRETPDPQLCYDAGITTEQAYQERRFTHVIEPFNIPSDWNIFRSYDFGYNKPFSVGWWAVDYDGIAYRILELYGCTKTPNEGIKWTPAQQMEKIAEIEREHPWLKGKRIHGVADPAIWEGSHGISIVEEADKRCLWFDKGVNDRIPGWMQVRERMKFDKEGFPMMYFFSNCKAIIRCMPLMMFDEHKPEDLDTDLEDHCLDDARYFCMMNPIPPRMVEEVYSPISDPLDQINKVSYANNSRKFSQYIRRSE